MLPRQRVFKFLISIGFLTGVMEAQATSFNPSGTVSFFDSQAGIIKGWANDCGPGNSVEIALDVNGRRVDRFLANRDTRYDYQMGRPYGGCSLDSGFVFTYDFSKLAGTQARVNVYAIDSVHSGSPERLIWSTSFQVHLDRLPATIFSIFGESYFTDGGSSYCRIVTVQQMERLKRYYSVRNVSEFPRQQANVGDCTF